MSDIEEVPYIFVPKREHQVRKQANSSNQTISHLKVNEIISIYLTNHEYMIEECESEGRKILSPVFEIVEKQSHQLIVRVLEVKYPVSLYYSDSEMENIFNAMKEGLAVVIPSEHVINIRLSKIEHVKSLDVRLVKHIEPIVAVCPKSICPPMDTIDGVMSCNNPNHGRLMYYLTGEPLYGTVLLDKKTGQWEYTNTIGTTVTDAFFITIWDRRGAYIEQKVIVQIKDVIETFYMEEQDIIHSSPGIYYGKIYNISHVEELGSFIENRGTDWIEVEIECGPTKKLFIKEAHTHKVAPGQTIFLTPVYYTPFVRLKFNTKSAINVHIWYYGHLDQ